MALAAQRQVHAAFAWFHLNPKTILDWQAEVCSIPAPPFGEQARSAWIAERFGEIGLERIETDAIGNVTAWLPVPHHDAESSGPVVAISAHLDTVFPAETPLHPILKRIDGPDGTTDDRLEVPGASDNGAGIAGLLSIAAALIHSGLQVPAPLIFLGNVGEEGEGDLRGVRHFYAHNPLAPRVAAHIVLDGAGSEGAVTQAVGSRRFRVTISGPGGHSFTDAGTPNPIAALARALAELAETPLPREPKTTLNVGTIEGGTSVNSIPESAAAAIDFRSTNADELVRLEVALHRAVEDAVMLANRGSGSHPAPRGKLAFRIETIGNRPAAALGKDSSLLDALRSVDRLLGIVTALRIGSTDANLPLSLGVPAMSLGAGGNGGGAHTLAEWYAPRGRDLALKRILLLALTMLHQAVEI